MKRSRLFYFYFFETNLLVLESYVFLFYLFSCISLLGWCCYFMNESYFLLLSCGFLTLFFNIGDGYHLVPKQQYYGSTDWEVQSTCFSRRLSTIHELRGMTWDVLQNLRSTLDLKINGTLDSASTERLPFTNPHCQIDLSFELKHAAVQLGDSKRYRVNVFRVH